MRRLTLLLLPALTIRALAADAPITPEAREFFEAKIRPTLASECSECHNATKHKGGLRLDYRDGWKKGGDSGDAIVPGDAKKSLLITSIRHEDPDLKMPAKAPKLDDKVIADFEKWVNMGAPDPRDQPPAEQAGKPTWPDLLAARRGWWSLQPVTKPALPEVRDAAWSEHPVDRFLLAKMEEHGLTPAPDADPRTVIRRLTFALTGLPPTPKEVDDFVRAYSAAGDDKVKDAAVTPSPLHPVTPSSSPREKAIEQITDRLLASRVSASTGGGTGSTSCATPRRTAARAIPRFARPGAIATTSSARSMPTCPRINSSANKSPATCSRSRA